MLGRRRQEKSPSGAWASRLRPSRSVYWEAKRLPVRGPRYAVPRLERNRLSMTIGYVKRVTFLCPAVITGGPEAIHQAAQLLTEQGLPTDIAYYGGDGRLHFDGGELLITPPSENPCLAAYAKYEPAVCRKVLLRRHHLVVLPETLATQARPFQRASVAIWWLSVDNALPGVDAATWRTLFADRDLKHFTQSAYAADFLRRNGVRSSYPLGDYTDAAFTSIVPDAPNPEPGLAYNPAKGADLADAFFAASPDLRGVPLRGMAKAEIVAALRNTMVYVDFGHLPGKDRLPREAAASGAVVFVRKLGAGRFGEDFPIPDFFRFDEDDVASGELRRRVAQVQADPDAFWVQQEDLRATIRGERATLRDQLLALRGRERAA